MAVSWQWLFCRSMTSRSSNPLTVVIADDEPIVRLGLARLLAGEPDVAVVAECADGEQAIAAVRAKQPDMLFLDVEMPGRSGLDVLAALGDARPRAVVFVTAFERYAVDAFDQQAVDYLLKPFDEHRFKIALARARERLDPEPEWLDRIPARIGTRVTLVAVEDVVWFEAADNYVRLHTEDGRHSVRETIRHFENRLDPKRFVRIHRSAIVSLRFVKELVAEPGGDYAVVLTTGLRLAMSRGYRRALEERLGRSLG